ncbi:hypothetical protein CE91St58_47990 [Lachnospiraceae bacterium]|nr:hypothetical protein CE91St58_47990 [Lachnospiraceae bacterium]
MFLNFFTSLQCLQIACYAYQFCATVAMANEISDRLLKTILQKASLLGDAGGIRRVILACGFVDLRKGINGFTHIIGSNTIGIHLKREPFSCSATDAQTS